MFSTYFCPLVLVGSGFAREVYALRIAFSSLALPRFWGSAAALVELDVFSYGFGLSSTWRSLLRFDSVALDWGHLVLFCIRLA